MYRTLLRELQSGRWGNVQAVASYNTERWQQTIAHTWRDDPAINRAGFVGDAGSHKIDAVFYLTGLRPVEVFANSDNCGSHVEIVTTVSAGLERDVPLRMSFIGNAHRFVEDLHIYCARASLILHDNRIWIVDEQRVEELSDLEPESNPDVGFLDLILDNGPQVAPAQCALPVFDFTQAILESSRSGTFTQIPAG